MDLRQPSLAVLLFAACASTGAQTYQPYEGQPGKDVVWVPTSAALVERMLDLAGVTAKDYVMDLGSGDGRMVIAAAKRGARAHGVEYETDMVALARRNAQQAGVALSRLHLTGVTYPDPRPGRYEPEEIARRFEAIAARAGEDPAVANLARDAAKDLGRDFVNKELDKLFPVMPKK